METQFTWLIEQMDCAVQQDGETDVVITAAWRCNGSQVDGENTYTGTVYGSCGFTYTGGDFTPYDQLTQEQVLGWCWSSGVDKDATEANVQTQIDNQINPPIVVLPLPWAA
jgi:hypothetical protein